MLDICLTKNCNSVIKEVNNYFCKQCTENNANHIKDVNTRAEATQKQSSVVQPGIAYDRRMSDKYPKYYKAIPEHIKEVDVYAVCQLFPVADDTGCINHARKKLLVPGTRTGGKSFRKDIQEARDTLNRWLELNPETE